MYMQTAQKASKEQMHSVLYSNNEHLAFSALTLLVQRQEDYPVCKNRVMRCKWFAYGPADATATSSSLVSLKSSLV